MKLTNPTDTELNQLFAKEILGQEIPIVPTLWYVDSVDSTRRFVEDYGEEFTFEWDGKEWFVCLYSDKRLMEDTILDLVDASLARGIVRVLLAAKGIQVEYTHANIH